MSPQDYVKFNARWIREDIPVDNAVLENLNRVRRLLMSRNLLGALPDGTGFGNISLRRDERGRFLITGSATGHLETLESRHLALVEAADMEHNHVVCRGSTLASSESLSHAACYRGKAGIKAVIHVHSHERWEACRRDHPVTPEHAAFGTPELALSIRSIVKNMNAERGLIVLGGHPEGLLAYGPGLRQAADLLL